MSNVRPHWPIGSLLMRPIETAIALLSLALATGPVDAADTAPPRYSIKQDEPGTGTNIKREIVGGSLVPTDKKYADLTREEQALVKSQYEQMGPNDEPPFPLNGLRPIYKAISAGQDKFLVTGTMVLLVSINSQGDATSVSVLSSPNPEMTQFAASVLMLHKYKPARCDGTPCAMQYPFRIALKTRF